MKTARQSLFHPATLTRLGGLVTIIVTTLAMGSVSLDQSGQAAAMVSKSFRQTLGASNDNLGVFPVGRDESLHQQPTPQAALGTVSRSFAQVKRNIDPAQDFQNLLPELERIAGEFTSESPMQVIQIDFMPNELEPASSISQQINNLLASAESQCSKGLITLEIQTYAASPTAAAWIEASREANRLRAEVTSKLSPMAQERFRITSSAGLWPNPRQSRPAATALLLL